MDLTCHTVKAPGSAMPDWWTDSHAIRDMLAGPDRAMPPRRCIDLQEIRPGWLVYDNEREPIGRVSGQIDRYVVVQRSFRGLYLWLRLYVPESAIGEAQQGSVLLNVPRDWIGTMGWDRPPRKAPTKRRHR